LAPAFHDGIVTALAAGLATTPGAPPAGSEPGPAAQADRIPDGRVPLVVAGAHLRGEALEHEVTGHGAVFVTTTRTAPSYRLHLVSESPPRPGLVRTESGGAAVEVDVWALPPEGWTAFVARGVDGLAVGRVVLADGTVHPGFVAASDTGHPIADLTPFGGWRAWRSAGSPVRR